MSNNGEHKIEVKKKKKRSSLKEATKLTELEIQDLQKRNKRGSVYWNLPPSFNLRDCKTKFTEGEEAKRKLSLGESAAKEAKVGKFEECRRKSIKNEYGKVRELLKQIKIKEEIENDEPETKENTKKNLEVGRKGSSSSDSS